MVNRYLQLCGLIGRKSTPIFVHQRKPVTRIERNLVIIGAVMALRQCYRLVYMVALARTLLGKLVLASFLNCFLSRCRDSVVSDIIDDSSLTTSPPK